MAERCVSERKPSSARKGATAESNPWRSRSPEWQIASPVPEVSYAQPFRVVGDPYDYGRPEATDPGYVQMKSVPAGE